MLSFIQPYLNRVERLLATDLRYLITQGTWLTLGQGLSSIIAIIMAIAFANLVPPMVYGTYKYLLSSAGLLTIFTLPGLNTAIAQAAARGFDGDVSRAFRYRLGGGLALATVSLIISGYYYWAGNLELGLGFLLIAIFTPLLEAALIYTAILSGKKLFYRSTLYSLFSQLTVSAMVLTTITLTQRVEIILLSYLASYAAVNLLCLLITWRTEVSNHYLDSKTIPFGLRLSGVSVLATAANYLDSIILWHFLGPFHVAIYNFALAAVTPAKTFLKSIFNLAMPKFATNDLSGIKRSLPLKMVKAFALLLLPIAAFIWILPYLFDWLFPVYREASIYAQVLAVTLVFFPEKLMGILFVAHVKEQELYTLNIINPLIKIFLFIFLIPLYGIWGAILATVSQQIIASLLALYLFYRLK